MHAASPHFLLYSEVSSEAGIQPRWRFVLQPIGGGGGSDKFLAAEEVEPGTSGNRLELLAVVRGLEAIEQPSRVTLLTASRYVNRGIRRGLNQWRERKWRWERFGQSVPIRNQDLWLRVDRAMQFHQVECCPTTLVEERLEYKSGADLSPLIEPTFPTAVAASPEESALLVVPRRMGRPTTLVEDEPGLFLRAMYRLRQGVLAPLSAIWRPAFTRAA